jgi:hypothetical protein
MTHGTATGWRHHKCRCDACHAGLLDEAKVAWAMKAVRAGRVPATRIPAGVARWHLRRLEAAGMTRMEVARRAGLSAGTISRLADPKTKLVSRITAAAVRNVVP